LLRAENLVLIGAYASFVWQQALSVYVRFMAFFGRYL